MISVVVCTHNRAELVCECISSLQNQTVKTDSYEIIVIDNASTDNTAEMVKGIPGVRYFFEQKLGLSHSRNRGFSEARFEWVTYIDDDAIAHIDLIEKTLETINTKEWDCFGGVFDRWFKYGQPKWYPEHFGTNKFDFDRMDILPNGKYACGGIITFRKAVLQNFRGFNPDYGMIGNSIGYGEETELQKRIRASGYLIGFNPEIKIDHLVARYKLSVWWHLKAAWKNERAVTLLFTNRHYPTFKTLKSILKACFKRLRYLKELRRPDYYWQNFVFDYSEPIIRKVSALYTQLKNR